MGKRKSARSKTDHDVSKQLASQQPPKNFMSDIPDFTPEYWEWLKQQSLRFEHDYVPTRSLIPGL